MEPLANALSQVLHTHSLPSLLMRVRLALNILFSKSQLTLLYFSLFHSTTVFLYIMRWQHVHTKSGPPLVSEWNALIASSTDTFLLRLHDVCSLLVSLRSNTCSGVSRVVSEPDPRKNRKEGLGDRLGRKCTLRPEYRRLPIDS